MRAVSAIGDFAPLNVCWKHVPASVKCPQSLSVSPHCLQCCCCCSYQTMLPYTHIGSPAQAAWNCSSASALNVARFCLLKSTKCTLSTSPMCSAQAFRATCMAIRGLVASWRAVTCQQMADSARTLAAFAGG